MIQKSQPSAGVEYRYAYNSFGQTRSVEISGGAKIEYLIDAENKRSARVRNGQITAQYIYDVGGRLMAELDAMGFLRARFIYATDPHSPDYMLFGGKEYLFAKDNLGSIRQVIDSQTGSVVQEILYSEFGEVLSDTNPGFQPFGFAGGHYDHETRLVRFGARDYDPELGRWLSRDPILFNGGLENLYSYTGGDPINYVDPEGTFPWLIAIGVAAGVLYSTPTDTEGAAQDEVTGVPSSIMTVMGIGAFCKAAGPAGPIFGRAIYRNGNPGLLNQGDTIRIGWSWNHKFGRNMFGVHGGVPKTPGHWHFNPIPGPKGKGW